MSKPYSFDNRLIGKSMIVSNENYTSDLLKVNGIYYRTNQKLNIGQHITIKNIQGNMLFIDDSNTQGNIHICLE